jgi:CheY-like chemotaxis protein
MPRILLIEQDPRFREWCRLHLNTAGFSVTALDDGRRALEALRGEPPDLIVLATNLSGMNAFALAAAIRSSVRSALVPIVFLVPAQDARALAEALSVEPEGVLTKPCTRELLLESLHARLGVRAESAEAGGKGRIVEAGPSRGAASGPLLETKQASVLSVVVRNFVSLARALHASLLDRFLAEFAAQARAAIFDAGGWIVRADAMSMVALFEETPGQENSHASRAIEAALGAVLASRAAKRWGESSLPHRQSLDVSVGCGVHTGEVIVARLTVGGHLSPGIAGPTAELAQRLEGRAKGLHWSIACSEASVALARDRFAIGQRAALTDTDHGITIPIAEILGYAPGGARPGELVRMGEVREALLANTMLASLAGDVDQETAGRTIMVRSSRPATQALPSLPERRVERRVRQSERVDACLATHVETGREELVKVLPIATTPPGFAKAYLEEYRKLTDIAQRNVATVYEIGRTADHAFVALEYAGGGSLAEALQRRVSVGSALNCLAQACMALDSLHQAGIVHGNLGPEHFLFRTDGSLVLADFNVTQRLDAQFGAVDASHPRASSRQAPREDFAALGRIFHGLLTGERSLLEERDAPMDAAHLHGASRLPLPLSPLQPIVDGLLGIAGEQALQQAPDVLRALSGVRALFPFDNRSPAMPPAAPRGISA